MTTSGAELPAIPDVLVDDENLRGVLLALKTIAEIREGRHIDTNQRFISYYELVNYLSGENQLVVEAVTAGHNHDPDYSDINHDHDLVYSLLSHHHDAVYSVLTHEHDSDYSDINHEHDADYSAISHDHDSDYSDIAHEHDYSAGDHNHDLVYSALAHDHDLVYSLLSHHHDANYSDISHTHDFSGDFSALGHNHDAAYEALGHDHDTDYEALGHNHDAAYEALGHDHDSDYSDISHNHAALYAAIVHEHDLAYSALGHNHDLDYSDISHNHNLADLAEKAYSSLTGRPTIPSAHSDLSDDEAAKHRLIADAGTSATVLWSASKIIAQLALKSGTSHDHDSDYSADDHNHNLADLTERAYASLTGAPTIPSAHSDLSDDESAKHRLISDVGTTTTVLWSAAKIIAQLALYSLDSHNHNLADLTEKAYSSLTGKPTIPSAHSDLSDDEATKHRLINDSGTSTTLLWSASKIIAQLALKSATSHHHDAAYEALGHDHDSDYSAGDHNHNLASLAEKAYSSLTGTPTIPSAHSDLSDDEAEKHRLISDVGTSAIVLWSASKIIAQLALKSSSSHNHDSDYSADDHDHDLAYSILSHNHNLNDLTEKAYSSLTGTPTIPTDHSDLSDDESAKHRLISDVGTSAIVLWSASKIIEQLALKSATSHNHDGDYDALGHDHDTDYEALGHNHNLNDLAEKAYASLTGKPTIPSAHSDLSDDEAVKHRLINDAGSTTTLLWSASKIIAQLALKSATTHNHNLNDLTEKAYSSLTGTPTIPSAHSDLSDDEATKHRLINDSGSSTTLLWSASKIIAQFALKSGTSHEHDSDYEALGHGHATTEITDIGDYARAAGYNSNDRHSTYAGDLNDIAVNSLYNFSAAGVTNEPSWLGTSWAFVWTHMHTNSTGYRTQFCWGMNIAGPRLAFRKTQNDGVDWTAWAEFYNVNFPPAHSEITEDEAEKHRLINDSGTLATELYSAAKVIALLALKSATSHDHDSDYSADDHNHNLASLAEKAYSSLTGAPTIPSAHSDLSDDEATKHRLINDSGTSTTLLWSASKIIAQLALKSASSHNHNLNDLTEKAYASLTGKPTIPTDHSDLADDEAVKHRLINDSGSSTILLWSASKIIAQLALKSASSHNHDSDYSADDHNHNLASLAEKAYSSLTGTPTIPTDHSDLSDDEATKHRLINDAGTTTTVLLSASKILALLALKSAASHDHDTLNESAGGLKSAEATTTGLDVLDTSGNEAIVNLKSSAGTNMGRIDATPTAVYLDNWDGSAWETSIAMYTNLCLFLYCNGAVKAFTESGGLAVCDPSSPALNLWTAYAGTKLGTLYSDTSELQLKNWVHGGEIELYGFNTGAFGRWLAKFDPDLGASLYDANNVQQLHTRNGYVDCPVGLKVGTSAVTADDILDEDDMASDSPTALVTQQSSKAYTDQKPNQNFALNSAFNISQLNTAWSPIHGYCMDMWTVYASTDSVISSAQTADAPTFAESGVNSKYCLEVTGSIADTSLSSGQYVVATYNMEGFDFQGLLGGWITVTFWAKASKAGIYSVSVQNSAVNRTYVTEYTISSVATWEKKTVYINLNESTGTWNLDNTLGMFLNWSLGSGSGSLTSSLDQWNSDGNYVSSNQTNMLTGASAYFRIANLKVERGIQATPFVTRLIAEDLADCQRYIEKTYSHNVAVGTVSPTGCIYEFAPFALGVNYPYVSQSFTVEKKAPPTVTIYSPNTGNAGYLYNQSTVTDITAIGYNSSTHKFTVLHTGTGTAQGHVVLAHWLAYSLL